MNNPVKKDFKLYLKLFLATFYLSAFTVGGGYVIIPLLQKKFVDGYGWLTKEDMLDYVAIGQSAPGVIAVNVSILVGFGIAGVVGSIFTILGTILPPMIIIVALSYFYDMLKDNLIFKALMLGLSCGVAAVIIDVVITMAKDIIKNKNILSISVLFVSLILAVFFNVNVIFILLGCIAIGVLATIVKLRRKL